MRVLLTLLFCLAALPLWAQCAGNDLLARMPPAQRAALDQMADAHPYPNGILWRATKGDQVVHLVGTMHFHEPRHGATMSQIAPWIEGATTVFLELGEGDEARLQRDIATNPSLAFLTEGPSLLEMMDPADWDRLTAAMRQRGVPGFMAAKMQPWMALMTLSATKCVIEGVRAGKRGLDQMIIERAKELGNPARALEDHDTVLDIFGLFSQDEMIEFLTLFLRMENFEPDDQHKTLVEAYFREEIRVIWEFALVQALAEPQGLSEAEILADYARLEDALIGARNRGWMDRILPAAEAGPVLVAAGALHLPGEQGLLRLLERQGFQVERVPRRISE
ncbi:GumN family protein [Candidatus Rhodobacter oscarellae]|uniref:GumN family protein n=1 Tax=Candidatus Rhodobacter oscarellae TaxID=1675527 RepID=A0A0J9EB82_9RHOB|nr:TraB/GumN family protein [Candidatus Rhodobacter lobularis]KMW60040.1 GumN family protein [Candidatus Rhodobacter lobularis]